MSEIYDQYIDEPDSILNELELNHVMIGGDYNTDLNHSMDRNNLLSAWNVKDETPGGDSETFTFASHDGNKSCFDPFLICINAYHCNEATSALDTPTVCHDLGIAPL